MKQSNAVPRIAKKGLATLLSTSLVVAMAPAAATLAPSQVAIQYQAAADEVATGTDTNESAVASYGGKSYETLDAAVQAALADTDAENHTVTLLKDTTGPGVKVESGTVVIDLGGHTYNITNPTVGSSGTETNAFQILKGSQVTFKNGKLESTVAQIMLQNYCNLTLDNVTINENKSKQVQYAVSNNCGSLTVSGNTKIYASQGYYAFDLWYGMSATYDDGINVTFNSSFNGVVDGNVEYGPANRAKSIENWESKAALTINGGTFTGNFVASNGNEMSNANITINGGTFNNAPNSAYLGNGCYTSQVDGKYVVNNHKVAVPSGKTGLVYNGLAQLGIDSNAEYTLSVASGSTAVSDNDGVSATNAGTYTATASPKNGLKWADDTEGAKEVSFTIAKAPLVATVDDTTISYSDVAEWIPTVSVTGFVNGETADSLAESCVYNAPYVDKSPLAELTEDGGTFELIASEGSADNYSFEYVAGTITVVPDEESPVVAGDTVHQTFDGGKADVALTVTIPAGTSGIGTVTFSKFENHSTATNFTIPDVVTIGEQKYKVNRIAKNAFTGSKVKTVTVGKNIVAIDAQAFDKAKSLTKVKGAASVTIIGAKAFNGCTKLSSLTISKKVKRVGAKAFAGCKKLKTVTVKSASLKSSKAVKNMFKSSKVKTVKIKGITAAKKAKVKKAIKKYGGKKGLKIK